MYNFIFAATGVVIHGTFCKKSLFSVPFTLLFTAQFPQKFLLGLLFSAQFRKNSAFAGQIVSLDTISRIFAGCCYSQHNLIFWEFSGIFAKFPIFLPCCYSQHNSRKNLFWISGCWNRAHNLNGSQNFKNPVSVAQFPKSAKSAPHDSCPKNNFFGLLCPAHCSFAHKTVVIYSTPQLESAAHFCCNFRHSYTLFLNIYK